MTDVGGTQAFRARYRAGIAPGYSGVRHAVIVFAFGFFGIGVCAARVTTWDRSVAWAIVAGLLTMNVGHYAVHRWLGHRKTRIGKLFYKRHSGDHHTFFTDGAYTIDSSRDLRVVLFPVYLLFGIALVIVPLFVGTLSLFCPPAVAWAFGSAVLIGYVWYEFVHLVDHLPDTVALTRFPVLHFLREHHRRHHNHALQHTKNMNITLPLTDVLLRTRV